MASSTPALKENRPVFACGAKDYTVRDVVEAAHFRGELEPLWRDFVIRCAAAQAAEESEAELDDAAIDEAAVAFRYQYDLITAEETEAWLEARGLTLADFSEYFARLQWAREFSERTKTTPAAYEESSPEERDLFIVDLILSGELDRIAERLAWRVAATETDDIAGEDQSFEKM